MNRDIVKQIAMEIVAFTQTHGTIESIDFALDELRTHFIFNPEGRHKGGW